jgi:translation initiation factor 2B subunit (eIF-2B alpha/beta/delta family)
LIDNPLRCGPTLERTINLLDGVRYDGQSLEAYRQTEFSKGQAIRNRLTEIPTRKKTGQTITAGDQYLLQKMRVVELLIAAELAKAPGIKE